MNRWCSGWNARVQVGNNLLEAFTVREACAFCLSLKPNKENCRRRRHEARDRNFDSCCRRNHSPHCRCVAPDDASPEPENLVLIKFVEGLSSSFPILEDGFQFSTQSVSFGADALNHLGTQLAPDDNLQTVRQLIYSSVHAR